ncbi:MAG: hypothetical protein JO069_07415 [Verrucomicrobia bacterium]|nr:hypothetical protein [Verrucomicrobiota bacterium]
MAGFFGRELRPRWVAIRTLPLQPAKAGILKTGPRDQLEPVRLCRICTSTNPCNLLSLPPLQPVCA